MIASLQGNVAFVGSDYVVVVVNGVGYKVFIPRTTFVARDGDEIHLFTEMIVREDAITLFGFATTTERDLFLTLTSVTGVGPKLGMAIVGTMSGDAIRIAVTTGQPDMLTRVPGIGKKMAEKLVFELKNKLKGADGLIPSVPFNDVNRDVLEALTGFGYSAAEAQAALASLPADLPNDFEERIRRALQYFV